MSGSGEPSPRPALLAEVVEAHGGWERWTNATHVEARVSTGGPVFWTHIRRNPLLQSRVRVWLHEQRVRITPYPREGYVGEFRPERVEIVEAETGRRTTRSWPRRLFFGLRRKIWWDPLDTLYFCGYALRNYLSFPRLLLDLRLAELEPWREKGERRRRLVATFPAEMHTHCREQVFHFDDEGLLRRHDYTVEIIGSWTDAAHYCDDHRDFGAGIFPTHRGVYPRRADGSSHSFLRLVWIHVHQAQLVEDR